MDLNQELESKGWRISHVGLELCKEGLNPPTVAGIINKALNIDLKEIGGAFFSDDVSRGKVDFVLGPAIVQIQKVKNATAPKYEYGSGAPAILRLLLTDGIVFVNCLQWGQWKSITMDTPPGTKIYLKPGKIAMQNNFMLLNENQFTVLGGCVTPMVEKWDLCRRLASHVRTKGDLDGNGPPPWIPFGKPINAGKPMKGKNFRSLETETKESKEEDEAFKQQRLANIAEVARVKEGKPKVFGGGKELKPPSLKPESSNFSNTFHNNSNESSNYVPKHQRNFNEFENKQLPRQSNDDKYSRNDDKYSRNDDKYSRNYDKYTRNDDKYSRNDNKYNRNDDKYTRNDDKYSRNDDKYNRNDDKFNRNDDKYNRNEDKCNRNNRTEKSLFTNQDLQRTQAQYENPSQGGQFYTKEKRFDQRNKFNTSDNQSSRNQGSYSRSFGNNNYRGIEGANSSRKFHRNFNDNSRNSCDKYSGNTNSDDIEDMTQQVSQVKLHGYDNRSGGVVTVPSKPFLKRGTEVMAKYWEDDKFYHAVVHAVGGEGTTCVVFFQEYGNYEEVLVKDVQQIQSRWNAGPFSFQPSHWENQEKNQDYRSSSESQNNSQRSSGQSYRRHEKQKFQRQDFRPSAELYQPPQQRQSS